MSKGSSRLAHRITILAMVSGILVSTEIGLRIFASPSSPYNLRLAKAKQIDPVTAFRYRPNLKIAKWFR